LSGEGRSVVGGADDLCAPWPVRSSAGRPRTCSASAVIVTGRDEARGKGGRRRDRRARASTR
jgi:hypothetical protein